MGRENDVRALGEVVELLHKHGALFLEGLDDVFVVDDLVADVDRRSEPLQGDLDDVYGPYDPRAEAAGRAELHFQDGPPCSRSVPRPA